MNSWDQPLYLYFMDRELNRAADQTVDPSTTERVLKTLLLGTTSSLYCGVSLLWESSGIDAALIPFLSLLLRSGALDTVSHHSTTGEFIESRRDLYAHDAARYPMYFLRTNDREYRNLAPTRYKDSSTTEMLNQKLISWALSYESSGTGSAAAIEALAAARKEVSSILMRRSKEAITFSLFSGNTPTADARKAVSGIVQRQISLHYTKHYMEFANGDIPTGITSFDFFDSNLSLHFPLYDIPILSIVMSMVGLALFLEEPWRVHEHTWAQMNQWRGTFCHSEFRNNMRLLLLTLKRSLLKNSASLGTGGTNYALRQAAIAAVRHCGVAQKNSPEVNWEDALVRLNSIVKRLSNDRDFAGDIEQVKDREGFGQVDVLLVTVNEIEKNAVLEGFRREVGHEYRISFGTRKTYYELGVLGGARVVMVQSEMGSIAPGASFSTIVDACRELRPRGVIAVGLAFGVDSGKQSIGDILVSRQVHAYEIQRVGTDRRGRTEVIPRGATIDASPRLIDRFRSAVTAWTGSKVRFGLVLSGEKLVDNIDFRDQLVSHYPEAVGGEMEAAGTYSAAYERHTDWIVVKAICDWADGKKKVKKKERQELAASNAANFIIHAIKLGGFASTPDIKL